MQHGPLQHGEPYPLGATVVDGGVNFALYSAHAESVWLCLFDEAGREIVQLALPAHTNCVWHGFLPNASAGLAYSYRVHGRYDPEAGLRFNPHKLLLDPYARELRGALTWCPEVFGYTVGQPDGDMVMDITDSAPFVPKGVVRDAWPAAAGNRRVPWKDAVIYETNPRGYTMNAPGVPEADRGTFRGLRNGEVLEYLKALGVTSVELMPVHAFVDEHFLVERGMRNYWGYNTLSFFAPAPRYLGGGDVAEFRDMVNAIHDAGLEVLLDVVYNHTAEGDHLGPTLSLRGIDNSSYYCLHPVDPRHYVNDSGCGNTLNANHPRVLQLIMDSLRYWARDMGVDGFRFDLATALGRLPNGFSARSPFFQALSQDPVLARSKLIAEPWDLGPGGYQLGGFPQRWGEWNDRYRDTIRSFWRGDANVLPEFARRVHGSSDLFEGNRRRPWASINFVASHDGFTTADLVSYAQKHNLGNGENNSDGHNHNLSHNHGVEGPTRDPNILALRRRQRLNLLATVLLSQGTPMLLAGDEFGNSQAGNNNAYAQDNNIGWLDWSGLAGDEAFTGQVRRLIQLRRSIWLLRQRSYLHGALRGRGGFPNIDWLGDDGGAVPARHWHEARHLTMFLSRTEPAAAGADEVEAVAIMFNGETDTQSFALPRFAADGLWHCEFYSGSGPLVDRPTGPWTLLDRSLALFVWRRSGHDD